MVVALRDNEGAIAMAKKAVKKKIINRILVTDALRLSAAELVLRQAT
jgi:hypothetical protein